MPGPDADGPGSWTELAALGKLTLSLLQRTDWVARRVETVSFVDNHTLERHVTLDVDSVVLQELVKKAGADETKPVLVPLAILEKGLFLDMDVRDAGGCAIPVATSEDDSRAAQGALLASLAKGGVDVATLSPAILKTIYTAARCFPDENDRSALLNPSQTTSAINAWTLVTDLSGHADDVVLWNQLLEQHEEFWSLLVNLTLRFMLMTPVKIDDGTTIIKFRYIEHQQASDLRFQDRLGIRSYSAMLVSAPAVAHARREHLHLVAPEGMALDSVYLWDDSQGPLVVGRRAKPGPSNVTYQRRLTPERASIYTSGIADGSYVIAFALRPKRNGFLRPSQFTLLASLVLLLVGATMELIGRRLSVSSGSHTEAAVAVLLVLPSLMSAYLANQGEHALLSDLLRLPRTLVALSAYSNIIAAGALVLGVSGTALSMWWFGAAAFTLAVFIQLQVTAGQSFRSTRDVRKKASETQETSVVILND
jgi:hypothetical protein